MNEQLDRIEKKLIELEARMDATYVSAEKTRKILFWTGVVSVVVIIGPLLLLPIFLPAFLASQGIGSAALGL